jgi:Ca-activated chloride channel homolog
MKPYLFLLLGWLAWAPPGRAQGLPAEVANPCADFLNEVVQACAPLFAGLRAHERAGQAAKSGQPARLALPPAYSVPQAAFDRALASLDSLPPGQQAHWRDQLQLVMALAQELAPLRASLAYVVQAKQYEQDGWEYSDQLLGQFALRLDGLEQLRARLAAGLLAPLPSVPAASLGPWAAPAGALGRLVLASETALAALRAQVWGHQPLAGPPVAPLERATRSLAVGQADYLAGLPRLGRGNPRCPHAPYETAIELGQQLAEHAQGWEGNPAAWPEALRLHNELVQAHNQFARLAPAPLPLACLQADRWQPAGAADSEGPRSVATGGSGPFELRLPSREPEVAQVAEEDRPEYLRSMDGYAYAHLVLVLDVSGSMVGKGKLAVLKQAMRQLLGILRPEDRVSVVAYADRAEVVLEAVSAKEAEHINQTIDMLQPGGGTNADLGLALAYRLAKRHWVAEFNNRIVLATDGEFPLADDTQALVERGVADQVRLSVFSFGGEQARLPKLRRLAQAGGGHYEVIDNRNAHQRLVREAKARKLDK